VTAGEVAWSAHAARSIAMFPCSPVPLLYSHLLCGARAPLGFVFSDRFLARATLWKPFYHSVSYDKLGSFFFQIAL
jgi:hypothetical protein